MDINFCAKLHFVIYDLQMCVLCAVCVCGFTTVYNLLFQKHRGPLKYLCFNWIFFCGGKGNLQSAPPLSLCVVIYCRQLSVVISFPLSTHTVVPRVPRMDGMRR